MPELLLRLEHLKVQLPLQHGAGRRCTGDNAQEQQEHCRATVGHCTDC
jgi:hypothetical protein